MAASSADEYFSVTRSLAAGPDVATRGREAGEALGSTIVGGMRLGDYLPTRTFELVAHTTDLASALGVPLDVPPGPAWQTLELVAALAVDSGVAGPLLRAALGRQGLPEGFSVLS